MRKLSAGLFAIGVLTALPSLARAGVVLSEVSPCTKQDGTTAGEWVEIRNDGTAAVDITGYTVRSSASGNPVCVTFSGTLAPGAATRADCTGSILNSGTQLVRLFSTSTAGWTSANLDEVEPSDCTGSAPKRSFRAVSDTVCASGAWTHAMTGGTNNTSNDLCNTCSMTTTTCTPSCTGKCGGTDGCGGTCPNTCTSPAICYSDACCTPNCTGKCGGTDGCGGTCANTCTGGAVCQADNTTCAATACTPGQVCRAATGDCDAAEICAADGTCPADVKKTSGTVCRASAGSCDPAETCNGTSATCPADVLTASGTVCRAGTGCDASEKCDGLHAECPTDTGTCVAPATCTNNVCVCTPSCSGKTCGNDGCGGLCGTCASGQTCTTAGTCTTTAVSTQGALETWLDGSNNVTTAMYQSDPACSTAGCDATGGTKAALINLINSATSDIRCALYELDDPDITSALKAAVTRLGTDKVRFVTDDDSGLATSASKDDFDTLASANGTGAVNAAGSNVQLVFNGGIMHDKFCVIDGKHLTFGTNNLKGSMSANMDLRFFVYNDTTLATTYTDRFNKLFCHCRGGTPGACSAGTIECSAANDLDVIGDTGYTVAGAAAEVYFSPNDGLNQRIRGTATATGSMAVCADNTCGCYLKTNGGTYDVVGDPYHYVSATVCTSNSDCVSPYYCDAAAGKCAKDTCKGSVCDDTGSILASGINYKGSHFALTDDCFEFALKKLHGRGGSIEMIQDALFWSNQYSAAKPLCAALNVADGTTSCTGDTDRFCLKVETVPGKDHEKDFCVSTATGSVCHIGSANISDSSEGSNTEDDVIFVNNAKVNDAFTRHMNKFLYGHFDGVAECAGQSTCDCNCPTGAFNDGNYNGVNDCTETCCTSQTSTTTTETQPTTGGTTTTSGTSDTVATCVANYCGKRCSHNSCACTADADCGSGNTCLAAMGGSFSGVTFTDAEAHDVLDLVNHGAEGDLDQITGVDYGTCILTGDTVATTCSFCNGRVDGGVRRDCASGATCSGAICQIVKNRPYSRLGNSGSSEADGASVQSLDSAPGCDSNILTNLKAEVAAKWCGAATESTNKSCGCSAPLSWTDAKSALWAPLIDPSVTAAKSVTSTNGSYTLTAKGRVDTRTLKTTTATTSVTFSYTTYCDVCQGSNCTAGNEKNYLCGNASAAPANKPYLNNYTYFNTSTISGAVKRFNFFTWETEATYDKVTTRYGADGNNDKLLDTIHGSAVTGNGTGWPHQSGSCAGLAEPNAIPGDTIQLALVADATMNGHCASATPCVADDPSTSVNEDACPSLMAGGKCDSNGYCVSVTAACGSATECAGYTYNKDCRPNIGFRLYKDCFR